MHAGHVRGNTYSTPSRSTSFQILIRSPPPLHSSPRSFYVISIYLSVHRPRASRRVTHLSTTPHVRRRRRRRDSATRRVDGCLSVRRRHGRARRVRSPRPTPSSGHRPPGVVPADMHYSNARVPRGNVDTHRRGNYYYRAPPARAHTHTQRSSLRAATTTVPSMFRVKSPHHSVHPYVPRRVRAEINYNNLRTKLTYYFIFRFETFYIYTRR